MSRLDLIALAIAATLTTLVDSESLKWCVGLTAYIGIRWLQVSSGQETHEYD